MLTLDDRTLIQHEINRVSAALRNNPGPHEQFVLESQLQDYQDRLNNPNVFEPKRREFFGEDYQ